MEAAAQTSLNRVAGDPGGKSAEEIVNEPVRSEGGPCRRARELSAELIAEHEQGGIR